MLKDLLGETCILTKEGPVHKYALTDLAFSKLKLLIEENVEGGFPDEELVYLYTDNSRFLAKWFYFENGEYIFLSKITQSDYLSGKQILLLKEEGKSAAAYTFSIRDFPGSFPFSQWNKITKEDTDCELSSELALEETTTALTTVALQGDQRIKEITPQDLLDKLPFDIRIKFA